MEIVLGAGWTTDAAWDRADGGRIDAWADVHGGPIDLILLRSSTNQFELAADRTRA